jgi:hypothetical protein
MPLAGAGGNEMTHPVSPPNGPAGGHDSVLAARAFETGEIFQRYAPH